jgi:transposase
MMAAISMDLRERIYDARQSGETTTEVADRFDVSPAFVRRLIQRHRETGSLAPSSAPRGRKLKLAGAADQIRQILAEKPDLTAAEIRDRLGFTGTVLTVWRMVRRLGFTFKKSQFMPLNKNAPTSNKRVSNGRRLSPNMLPDD